MNHDYELETEGVCSDTLPIFRCTAIKTFSGEFMLLDVLNDKQLFKDFDIFSEGDCVAANLFPEQSDKLPEKVSHITFSLRVVDLDFGELEIFDIETAKP